MKLLLDMNIPPMWVYYFKKHGITAKHWSEVGKYNATDIEIMEWARANNYVVFTHDLDFGALLYATRAISPSVIQIRNEDIRPATIGEIVIKALKKIEDELKKGALVVIDPKKSRVRLLPLKK